MESFPVVPDAAVNDAFPMFGSLHVLPFSEQADQSPVDWILLQNPISVGEFDPDVADTSTPTNGYYFAEYDAYDAADDTYRESGILGFSLQTDVPPLIEGSNIIGFVRRGETDTPVPSTLLETTEDGTAYDLEGEQGYFHGLHGTIAWDFATATRRAYFWGSGANYSPNDTFLSYTSFQALGSSLSLGMVSFPVPGAPEADPLNWTLSIRSVRALADRTSDNDYQYFALALRNDGLDDEDLTGLVPAESGAPWQLRNRLYLFRIQDVADYDADGIPDFLDLTQSFQTMPPYADIGGPEDKYYSYLFKAWVYSSRTTDWDYLYNKFGWIYWPNGAVFERNNFWFYGASEDLGWMWSNESWPNLYYRHNDGAWLRWRRGDAFGPAVFYNYNTDSEETINF